MMIHASRTELAIAPDPSTDFVVGGGAAFVATVLKLPADIAKSRIQNQISKSGTKNKYRSVLQVK